ncbi:CYTH domain [Musa troglodytarum]|uniref:CYTH domain n=1 Tax=Musa troglodytarum TaxID=320322 RepID=A0A9E7I691_9LILI|nr:CYTH domain [Musa troglodytarum]
MHLRNEVPHFVSSMPEDNTIIESPRRRHGLLRDQVQLVKRKDSDRYEIVPIQDPLSFEKGFFIVIRACQLLAQKNDGIILVGVAGPSGAGKTVFTEKVLNFMPSIAVISMDNYNDSSRIVDGNFDVVEAKVQASLILGGCLGNHDLGSLEIMGIKGEDPRLTDYDTLLENIRGLREGKSIRVPIYDFKSSSRIGYRTVDVPSSRIVILEGIYALSEKLRPLLDLRVSVTGGVHFDLVKRVLRDIQRAGQEPEEIIHQISETVYPMYKAFIEPDLQTAHIKISNKFNPFTGFQNPTYILKSPRSVSVDKIKAVLSKEHKEYSEQTYDIYLLPPGEDPEACQSYLRMRNRDGKYNLMFEEWVTDSPFIISPRITFEVSVRLLGGLMALGYTIAAILKRSSHVFSDDRVVVKIDWLEQLKRTYVQTGEFGRGVKEAVSSSLKQRDCQFTYPIHSCFYCNNHFVMRKVQGKERLFVRYIAEQLGLEGSFIPRTYIEQIQLEKLVNEVLALPDDLRTKLSIDDDLVSSPREALSRASADRVAMRNKHLKSGMSHSYSTQRDKNIAKLTRLEVNSSRFDGRTPESPAVNREVVNQLSEQISTLNERIDEFSSQIKELSSKFSSQKTSVSQQNLALQNEACNGSVPTSVFVSNLGNGTILPSSSSSTQLNKDSPLMEELVLITRGQRQVMHQLDNLSNLVHEQLAVLTQQVGRDNRSRLLDLDLIGNPALVLLVGGISFFLFKNLNRN